LLAEYFLPLDRTGKGTESQLTFRNRSKTKLFSITALLSFLFYIIIVQVFLSIVFPPACIVSNSMGEILAQDTVNLLSETGKSQQLTEFCNYTLIIERSLSFFGCSINPDEVNFFWGGLPDHESTSVAVTIDSNVFIRRPLCVSESTLVHELAHVWQFQKGYWYGSVGTLLSWLHQQSTNRTKMYDYGGKEGLEQAQAAGKTFLQFNLEQQATMVEDYYLYKDIPSFADYIALLKEFTSVVFDKCQ